MIPKVTLLRWVFSTQLWATYTSGGRGRLEGSKRDGDEVRRRRRRESGDLRRRGSVDQGRGGGWDDNGELERERRDRTAIIRRQKENSRLIDPFSEYLPFRTLI